MTIVERNNKLKHFITCLKCEVSGKCCDDNCSTQYDAGNMGEIIANLEAISKALEQQPCEDCISRQAVIDALTKTSGIRGDALKALYDLPPITPQLKMGCWIEHFDESGKWDECDQCHTDWGGPVNYCPNCGAKMAESEEK